MMHVARRIDEDHQERRRLSGIELEGAGRRQLLQKFQLVRRHLTDHAQEQLGEIVYIELPAVGDKISKDDPFGVVESVKAVSDIYAPVSGTVIEVNEDLPESPEVVNEDPYGDGWLVKVQMNDPTDLEDLMDNNEYEEMIAREKE